MTDACTPGKTPPSKFDVSGNSCLDICTSLLEAYLSLAAGAQRLEVRFNERWVTYGKGNIDALRNVYMIYWRKCPAAREVLPDLNTANAVNRGPPRRGLFSFPKM